MRGQKLICIVAYLITYYTILKSYYTMLYYMILDLYNTIFKKRFKIAFIFENKGII